MIRLALLLACTAVLAACGGTAERSTTPSAAQPRLAAAPLGAVKPYERPGGIQAADGRSSYAIERGVLRRISAVTGKPTKAYPLKGRWELTGVSATGDWVALQRPRAAIKGVQIAVLDATTGRRAHLIELGGDFRVETVSTAGDFLFLQQNFVDGSYAVRGYDLAAGQMLPGSLGRKGQTVKMQGEPGQVVASPDGRWLLTVYVETTTNTAFVHALNLIERNAICIFLPPCKRCGAEDWTLDLAADGRTLRASNEKGGRATIDLERRRVVES